jgi:hypothetical protein
MSVIRFRELVKTAGTPEPKSLWTDPKHDPDFLRAVKQNRVLTVVQESRKKDFGELGYHQHPCALYFVFPKPLPAESGRVIGIKYEMAEAGEPADAIPPEKLKRAAKARPGRSREPEKPKTVLKTFQVTFRQLAVLESTLRIEARSKAEASKEALKLLEQRTFDVANAKIKNEIKSVK